MRSFFMSARTADQINDCFIQIASELSGVKTLLPKSPQKTKSNPRPSIQEEEGGIYEGWKEEGGRREAGWKDEGGRKENGGRREERGMKEEEEEGGKREEGVGGSRRKEEGGREEERKRDERLYTDQNERKTAEMGNKQFGVSQNRESERKSVSANMPQRKLMTEKGRESKGNMSDINKMTMGTKKSKNCSIF